MALMKPVARSATTMCREFPANCPRCIPRRGGYWYVSRFQRFCRFAAIWRCLRGHVTLRVATPSARDCLAPAKRWTLWTRWTTTPCSLAVHTVHIVHSSLREQQLSMGDRLHLSVYNPALRRDHLQTTHGSSSSSHMAKQAAGFIGPLFLSRIADADSCVAFPRL
jgi:hypothetical protein